MDQGADTSVPISDPFAKNFTDVIVPSASDAFAVSVVGLPAARMAPAAGDVIDTTGAEPTVTVTGVDVVLAPWSSVAIAVRMNGPGAVGVHVVACGLATVSPIVTPFAR